MGQSQNPHFSHVQLWPPAICKREEILLFSFFFFEQMARAIIYY